MSGNEWSTAGGILIFLAVLLVAAGELAIYICKKHVAAKTEQEEESNEMSELSV